VVERVPIEVHPNPHNAHYLETKRVKLGHLLTPNGGADAPKAARKRRRQEVPV